MRISTQMATALLVSMCWMSFTASAQPHNMAYNSDSAYQASDGIAGQEMLQGISPAQPMNGNESIGDSYSTKSCVLDTANCSAGYGGLLSRPGQFFFAADYLYVRSTFSEAPAYAVSSGTPTGSPPTLAAPVTHTLQQLDFDYESSYRFAGGYRLGDCGGEVRFNFTRFNSSASQASPAVDLAQGIIIRPHHNEPLILNGESVSVNSSVDAKSYDLGFAKTIALGALACSSGCDSCCGECDPCCAEGAYCCPAWDLKWSAGVRFAEVNWDRNSVYNSTVSPPDGSTRTAIMDFEGGGVRVGLEGLRYIGACENFSLFARSDVSLLLGTVDLDYTYTIPVAGAPQLQETVRFSNTQIIPVLDVEVGANVFITKNISVSAGYLFSAWFDLGMRDTFDMIPGTAPTMDDANILGFDGLFARAEVAY